MGIHFSLLGVVPFFKYSEILVLCSCSHLGAVCLPVSLISISCCLPLGKMGDGVTCASGGGGNV